MLQDIILYILFLFILNSCQIFILLIYFSLQGLFFKFTQNFIVSQEKRFCEKLSNNAWHHLKSFFFIFFLYLMTLVDLLSNLHNVAYSRCTRLNYVTLSVP